MATREQRGSILPKGKGRWLIRGYHCVDADSGKEIRFKKTIRGTQKDAQRALTKEYARVEVLREPAKVTQETLGSWLDKWFSQYCAHIRKKTRESYKKALARVPATLRAKKLTAVTSDHVQALLNDLAAMTSPRTKKPLARTTVRGVRAVLRVALMKAELLRLVPYNVAAGRRLSLPEIQAEEMKALSPGQAQAFLKACEEMDAEMDQKAEAQGRTVIHHWTPFFTLSLTSGLRPGELVGLKWADLSGNKLRVLRQLSRFPGGKWELTAPKTKRSRRVVTLPEVTVKALKRHKADQAHARLLLGAEYNGELDLIFATHTGEPLDWQNIAHQYFRPLLKRAKLPNIRPYDLRHTAATLLLAAGEHPKIVSERLGHSTITLTLDTYSHVLPDMQDGAAARLDSLLASAV
jgi:integrase